MAEFWADLGGDLHWLGPCAAEPADVPIPLAGEAVEAGFPSPAADYVEAMIDLNVVLMPRPASTFLMRVSGDAMREAGIHHGDLLVIDRSLSPVPGTVVVAVHEGRFVLRWLVRARCGTLWKLEAADPGIPAIPVQHDDPDLLIWGVVIHAVHHLLPRTPCRWSSRAAGR
ncbi:MAG: translesion error-prone DNA polymerase V autoproteolytic subunit [Cyanobacteriota bacterium]|nr:translesion error-prone DNA polymerase V autoproteolytic subunit [Cyanobacteriota bacterium]